MIAQIRPRQFADWLQTASADGAPVVLDVRDALELQAAAIKPDGFTVTAIPMAGIPARIAELDPAQPIACLCHHGIRSQRVAAFLEARGFAHVVNIAGGIEAWSNELDPSVARY